ncbi:oligosaccharide flippase family protein [Roseovarius sp.]|uniref:oligosaccharide flippase family protein n=1 Tax=Roseovarius sp. TaxID=1486281 RepID=UPI000C3D26D4|nr:oligosaccharide flippase family protein [Roseovarius sp.]MAZ20659.1 polysaccharide biosynthesis protein [Roseovarius sp.]
MKGISGMFTGSGLMARLMRSGSWVLIGYGGSQAIRLASNLILTRLLFPEAFGLMALVSVVTVGLMMFSDVGVGPSIAQSKRGDDPAFLDTAFSIQILRGALLWLATIALAGPMARFYDQPDLVLYLPIAGIALLLLGFKPTKVETAQRHLRFGGLTMIELASQAIGVVAMVVLALVTESVISLVLGSVVQALVKLILAWVVLPGHNNRPRIERAAMAEQMGFGKWVFLSTAFAFVSQQGDKAILGKLLSLETLGIYNIGYFLAGFPILLGVTLCNSLLIPVYRDRPPAESAENRAKLGRMRFVVTSALFAMLSGMALLGPWVVDLLYDARYAPAGAMLVVIALAFLPQAIGVTYERAALAAGDSRGAFVYSGLRAVLQVGCLLVGFRLGGLVGGMVSYGVAMALVHPLLIRLARRHQAWGARHDAGFAVLAALIIGAVVWLHWPAIAALGHAQ